MRLQNRLDARIEPLELGQNFLLAAIEVLDPLPRFFRRTLKGDHESSLSVHRDGGQWSRSPTGLAECWSVYQVAELWQVESVAS
jgi:hypothetical protein